MGLTKVTDANKLRELLRPRKDLSVAPADSIPVIIPSSATAAASPTL